MKNRLVLVSRGAGRRITVAADVTNAGRRAGADVVQVYVGFPALDSEPPLQLKAFRKVVLAPGGTRHVTFTLGPRAFAHWDSMADGWVVSPGSYRIGVGDSSADLPLGAEVRPTPGPVR